MKLGAMINFARVTSVYRTPRVELGKATTLKTLSNLKIS